MERERSLELLRQAHSFPGPFEFRVVIRPEVRENVMSVITSAAGPSTAVLRVGERASAQGAYLALHVELHLERAEQVLEVYAAIKTADGVVFTL